EDGIRDFHVTGVQTCALPIYRCRAPAGDRAALLVEQLAVPGGILGVVVEVALADAVGADAETQPVGNVAVVEPPGAVAQVMIVPQGDIAVAGMLEGAIPGQQVSRCRQARS